MIIGKNGIPMLKVGYPTVSDKYNVVGGILTGNSAVTFGQLVKYTNTPGYYELANNNANIAGFVLATNVKMANEFDSDVYTLPGETFNLLLNGYIAVDLDAEAVDTNILPNKSVYVTSAGKITTEEVSNTKLENCVFTGIYEKHGEVLVAEVLVK